MMPCTRGAGPLWLCLLGILALACGKSPGGAPDGTSPGAAIHKKVFSYARLQSHKNLDPQKQFDGASAEIVGNVYDTEGRLLIAIAIITRCF